MKSRFFAASVLAVSIVSTDVSANLVNDNLELAQTGTTRPKSILQIACESPRHIYSDGTNNYISDGEFVQSIFPLLQGSSKGYVVDPNTPAISCLDL